jgi:hypothetical protein
VFAALRIGDTNLNRDVSGSFPWETLPDGTTRRETLRARGGRPVAFCQPVAFNRRVLNP